MYFSSTPGNRGRTPLPAADSAGEPARFDPGELDGRVNLEAYRSVWGRWAGQEAAFYGECARLVELLAWEQVTDIGGPEISLYSRLVQEAYRELVARELPAAAEIGTLRVAKIGPEFACVFGYSISDPLELPRALLDVLPSFDGRPTEEAISAISAEKNIKVHPELVRKLVDFQILVPAAPSSDCPR